MLKKLVWMWIKGSAALVVFLIISLVLKTGAEPLVEVSSPFFSWVLTFLLALTPVGALLGYIVILVFTFIFKLIMSMIFGDKEEHVTTRVPHAKQNTCPFASRVYFENDTTLFGHNWEKGKEAVTIEDDWSIKSYAHGVLGWIDVSGEIHDTLPLLGTIDPQARLSGGPTGLRVVKDSIWQGSEKVGWLRR